MERRKLISEAFIDSIRTVMLVDDQFARYDQPEADLTDMTRGYQLWRSCIDKGYLCDVDNKSEWRSDEIERRLALTDLVVLDYELAQDDPKYAENIVKELATNKHPNLVAIYTRNTGTRQIALSLATQLRGILESESLSPKLEEKWEELEDTALGKGAYTLFDIKPEQVAEFLNGERRASAKVAELSSGLFGKLPREDQIALCQKALSDYVEELGAEVVPEERPTKVSVGGIDTKPWVHSGNVFIVVVHKGEEESVSIDTIINPLLNALCDWCPDPLRVALARARAIVRDDGYHGEALGFPAGELAVGFWYYQLTAQGQERRQRRSRILKALFDEMRDQVAQSLESYLEVDEVGSIKPYDLAKRFARATKMKEAEVVHRMNAFLCTMNRSVRHLTTGTVFRFANGTANQDSWWVCMSPACDTTPRPPSEETQPWHHSIHPNRFIVALQLKVEETFTGLQHATRGRHIFLRDNGIPLRLSALSPNNHPQTEMMFVCRAGLLDDKFEFEAYRMPASDAEVDASSELKMKSSRFVVVTQLRKEYAERLLHQVGHHLSRVGVDFFDLPQKQSSKPKKN